MLPSIRIGIKGEDTINRKIGLVAEVIGDLAPTFRSVIGPYMVQHMRSQFSTEGAHGGAPWAGYDKEPKYRAYKRAILGHLSILRWQKGGPYELLYPSLTALGHPANIFRVTPTSAVFGTSVPHAEELNRGGIGPFGEPYPARKIIAMTGQQKNQLFVEIQRDILRRVGPDTIRSARFV